MHQLTMFVMRRVHQKAERNLKNAGHFLRVRRELDVLTQQGEDRLHLKTCHGLILGEAYKRFNAVSRNTELLGGLSAGGVGEVRIMTLGSPPWKAHLTRMVPEGIWPPRQHQRRPQWATPLNQSHQDGSRLWVGRKAGRSIRPMLGCPDREAAFRLLRQQNERPKSLNLKKRGGKHCSPGNHEPL